MLIPQYWAEATITCRNRYRHTAHIKRMGWSDVSQEDAQRMAQQRCEEALAKKQADPNVPWRDERVAYNGWDGLPIREEVLERAEDFVITRNTYGAACLNSPNVLFVDIDFTHPKPFESRSYVVWGWVLGMLAGAGVFWLNGKQGDAGMFITVGVFVGVVLSFLLSYWLNQPARAAYEQEKARFYGLETEACCQQVEQHARLNPGWNWRVYRTPHGMRLLATHQTFDPRSDEVQQCFDYFKADSLYASMCTLQNCFRARVSPKPWRMHMAAMQPRAVWPVPDEALRKRQKWVQEYEKEAVHFASCNFVYETGSGVVSPDVRATVKAHDSRSRALSDLPLA